MIPGTGHQTSDALVDSSPSAENSARTETRCTIRLLEGELVVVAEFERSQEPPGLPILRMFRRRRAFDLWLARSFYFELDRQLGAPGYGLPTRGHCGPIVPGSGLSDRNRGFVKSRVS